LLKNTYFWVFQIKHQRLIFAETIKLSSNNEAACHFQQRVIN